MAANCFFTTNKMKIAVVCILAVLALTAEAGKLKIAAFNIQVLGKTKMGKPDVVADLVKVCAKFCRCYLVHHIK